MPTQMTEEELEAKRASATAADDYAYRSDDDEDDYFTAILYKAEDGRHFRYIESSGMNSQFGGSFGRGEWLTDEEAKRWNENWNEF